MYEAIEPAEIGLDAAGVPFSRAFGDVYHSADGAIGQARHVFLAGNRLPEAWQGRERFTVLETGFGLGLNFLVTWAAWRADPARCRRLHFVSLEKHPPRREDLARLFERWPELRADAERLVAAWPPLVPGLHRLHFEGGRLSLSLCFGDAAGSLEKLEARADALYLDGFSPARNPELWSPRVCHLLARRAAPGATLATWSVSGPVREALSRAGFDVGKARGFGSKREMLVGVLGARRGARPGARSNAETAGRSALVIGAGLAGSAVAHRLAERGWQIALIDEAPAAGLGASGNLAGVLRPLPSLDDNPLSRLTRAGTLYGLRHLRALDVAGFTVRWSACGVLHLARDPGHEKRQRALVEAHRPPPDYLRQVGRDEAAQLAQWPVAAGGWWFAGAGWVMPPSLCRANLASAGEAIRPCFGRHLARLERAGGLWRALDGEDRLIAEAPLAILANGAQITAVDEAAWLPVRAARGQVTHLPAAHSSAPRVVVCRLGYVSPEIDGTRCVGATFQVDDLDPALRAEDQAENMAKLDYLLPGFASTVAVPGLAGRVGFRPASPDRLPLIGAVPTGERPPGVRQLADLPRHPDLYAVSGFGARGLVWSSLAGELLAGLLESEPLPLERDIVDALDPGRFLLRPSRRAIRNSE